MIEEQVIGSRDQRMLELLADGGTSRSMAEKLGYQEGTMRVYLHNLYRKLGVANKTEAVVWYFHNRARPAGRAAEAPAPPASGVDFFGDFALEEGLYAALGVMSRFIGPCSRVWEVGLRVRGQPLDASRLARRDRVRGLWRALLQGDCAYGKRAFDAGLADAMLDAPSDAVLLVALLQIGGFTSAAQRVQARLTDRRKVTPVPSAREVNLMRSIAEAVDGKARASALQRMAQEKSASPVLKHVALVALYHACSIRRDAEHARQAANALWTEAEAARKHLEAMGERPFGRAAAKPARGESTTREKAAASR